MRTGVSICLIKKGLTYSHADCLQSTLTFHSLLQAVIHISTAYSATDSQKSNIFSIPSRRVGVEFIGTNDLRRIPDTERCRLPILEEKLDILIEVNQWVFSVAEAGHVEVRVCLHKLRMSEYT